MTSVIKPTLLNTKGAAARTPFAPGYFNKLRMKDKGPAYIQIGNRVFYDPAVVDAWLEGHRVDPAGAGRLEPAEGGGQSAPAPLALLADN